MTAPEAGRKLISNCILWHSVIFSSRLTCINSDSELLRSFQVANLFSKGSARVVALLNGAFDTSSAVQLIVKVKRFLQYIGVYNDTYK